MKIMNLILKGGRGEWGEVDQGGEFLENNDDA